MLSLLIDEVRVGHLTLVGIGGSNDNDGSDQGDTDEAEDSHDKA